MIGIQELIELHKAFIEYVFENIDWDFTNDEGEPNEDELDEDELLDCFLFQSGNHWIEGSFDIMMFIAYTSIDDVDEITGQTLFDLIQIIQSYHMDCYGECHIDFANLTIDDVVKHWAYVHTHSNIEEIREKIRDVIDEEESRRYVASQYW